MALPKYPELKFSLEKMMLKYFENKARQELEPFGDVRKFRVHEGKSFVHNTLDDTEKRKESEFKQASVEYKIKHEDIPNMRPDDVLKILDEQAKDFGGQQAKIGYQVLEETTKESGNVVDAGGKPLTYELFLDTISKISISFDKFGKPQMPTLVIHPNQEEKYKKMFEDADNDDEAKEKLRKILEAKKKEYNAEQARRKLVD